MAYVYFCVVMQGICIYFTNFDTSAYEMSAVPVVGFDYIG
jgi:hypothetical protein